MADAIEKIGNYKITAVIAKGGMGTVYKAIHPSLNRYVVIKKLSVRGSNEVIERFKREAQIMLDLMHPNIVHMFDFIREGNRYYIVLEYIDGVALDKLLKKRTKLTSPVAMLILRDTCLALQYAHSKGIIHRDIKPGNILMTSHADIKLADFGIASSERENEDAGNLTKDGSALGTPSYMPPEQFSDTKTVDNRADIYSLGVMLYEMTTGQKPFPSTFSAETLNLIQSGKYENPKKLVPELDKTVCALIKKMIKPKASKRFQSVDKILKIANKYLEKYDVDKLRQVLSEEIKKDKNYKEPVFKVKKSATSVVALCASCCVFALLCVYVWKSGFVHKTLLRKWYTPIELTISLPKSARGDADLPIRALFFDATLPEIPEVKNSARSFLLNKDSVYATKPLYLKHGSYRIKVVTGSFVWWQTVNVQNEKIKLNLNFLQNEKRSIKVHQNAYDSVTGKAITEKCEFLYQNNAGKWVDLSEISEAEFTNGRVWSIKVLAKDYETQIYDLRIEWYQDELFLNALLVPKQKM